MLALRQYLLTLVMLAAGLICGWPHVLTFVGVALAALVDFAITSRSADLDLYRQGLELDVPAGRQLTSGQAIRVHLIAAVASASIALAPRAFEIDSGAQQISGMIAALTAGSIASYCGLQILLLLSASPRDLLTRLDFMPHLYLSPLNSLSPRVRRRTGAFIRATLGTLFLLPFAALAGRLQEEPLSLQIVLAVMTLAVIFQLAFVSLLQGVFLLRWASAKSSNSISKTNT